MNEIIVVHLHHRNNVLSIKQEKIMDKVYVIVKVDVYDGDDDVTIVGVQ